MKLGHAIERWWKGLRGTPQDEHEQRLIRLYWNRAELKKELAELQDQRQKMLATLDSHQAAIRRAGEQIDELAAYLGRPEVGAQALLYFQLRALWLACSKQLALFASGLCVEQEQRERARHQKECTVARAAQLARFDERILNAHSITDSLHARIEMLERKLTGLKWFWQYRRRRDLRAEIAQVRAQADVAATNALDLNDERAALAEEPPPNFPGLSTEGKRAVNTAVIAYAEWLITLLPLRLLAPMSRHAISVQIFDARLGSSGECERFMEVTRAALARIAALPRDMNGLKEITERTRTRAVYRSTGDAIPAAESLGVLTTRSAPTAEDPPGTLFPTRINIVSDDYWSVGQVLLR